jgi:hypothetical protein
MYLCKVCDERGEGEGGRGKGGGRTIYVTDGILEELCHQYKDPV